jgi:site-specific recombinase XerD
LGVRRRLGFELRKVETTLRKFVTFAEKQSASYITVDLMLRWAKESGKVQAPTKADRLAMVRRFALWRSASDPRTEVPPEDLLSARYRRKPPYIYTDEEVERLVRRSAEIPSRTGLRGLTYSTFFGLIAVTGMRMSEGLALDRGDVDLDEGVLTIRRSKFGASRLVPVHSSTRIALQDYAERRDRLHPRPATRAFFLAERGTRITNWSAAYHFAKVSQRIGLRTPIRGRRHGRGPRVHDLRHRFAVRTLIDWYRAGRDVEREIPKLATYLGHVHVNDTYWYLEAVPELLQMATDRLLDRHREEQP